MCPPSGERVKFTMGARTLKMASFSMPGWKTKLQYKIWKSADMCKEASRLRRKHWTSSSCSRALFWRYGSFKTGQSKSKSFQQVAKNSPTSECSCSSPNHQAKGNTLSIIIQKSPKFIMKNNYPALVKTQKIPTQNLSSFSRDHYYSPIASANYKASASYTTKVKYFGKISSTLSTNS